MLKQVVYIVRVMIRFPVTAVRYIATKEKSLSAVVEGDDLQDVKHDCSSAFTLFVQQSMITMMLTVYPLTFLI
jgi:hypothetical protein